MGKWIKSRPVMIGIAVVVVLVGIGIARSYIVGRRGASNTNTTWATGQATVGPIAVTVSGTGALQPGSTADVRTEIGGTVRRILVANGASVSQGTPLLEMDNEAVLLSWEQARLTFEEESETLAELLAGTSSASTAIRSAQLKVEQARLALEAKREAVDNLTISAPAAGRILSVDASPGDVLSAGGLVLSMVEGPTSQLTLTVTESEVKRIGVGNKAAVIFGPLPQVHVVKIQIYEQNVYGLSVGDPVTAVLEGQWAGLDTARTRGAVVSIDSTSGAMFEVVCRLPALPDSVPSGANVSLLQIYPTGSPIITASGRLSIETDVWGLDVQQAQGEGQSATVVSVDSQATRTASGEAVYGVTLQTTDYPADARIGMSVHGYIWPSSGNPISGVVALDLPLTRKVAVSGGTVKATLVKPGQSVVAGQLLAVIDNPTLVYQLEDAANSLAVAEENLIKVSGSGDADRQIRLQEIKTRQAELTLELRLADVQALRVAAPQDGVVTGINETLTIGKTVTTGTSVCRVLNYESMQLTIQVDELEVAWVQPGLDANVSVDALPGKVFPAKVLDVAQEGTYQQGVSKFTVKLQVASSPQLRAQMTSTATIRVAERAETLLVPAEAVAFLGDGFGTVNVVGKDGKITETRIEIGLYNDSYVEVLDGIAVGTAVITGSASTGSTSGFPATGGTGGLIPGGVRPR